MHCRESINILDFLKTRSESGLIALDVQKECAASFGVSIREVEDMILRSGFLPARYQRNRKTFTIDDQYRLFKSSVAVIGCGGLGGYLIEELARVGVGTIKAVDPDLFEEHNLNRQILSSTVNIGKPKVEIAMARAAVTNPSVNLIPLCLPFKQETGGDVLQDVQVVADALDSIHTRLALALACHNLKIPLVHGSVGGWYGQVSVQQQGDDCLIRLFDGRADKGAELELGNPSFTPAVISSLQSAEICKLLTGKDSALRNKLLAVDLYNMKFTVLNL